MKRRIAYCDIEKIVGQYNSFKDIPSVFLKPQFNPMHQYRITGYYFSGICYRNRVDVRTHESPAVLRTPDDRVNAIGSYADIQTFPSGYSGCRIFRTDQLGNIMNVVGPSRDGRTQIIFRNIPISNAIITDQQCFIQCLYCLWIKKINRLRTVWIE